MNKSHRITQYMRPLVALGILLSMSVNFVVAQELSLGWEDWQPYQYRDSNEAVTGLDIELVQARLGKYGLFRHAVRATLEAAFE